ncbi:MAG: inositol monophosphatase [Flammeovirgaceae bacterium]|nr:inositol monophosphatase [Flammeovirgaceae bacterium]MDW8287529.1 inositol monophosphatase family protein [Flammeovirgaceae bacterium]
MINSRFIVLFVVFKDINVRGALDNQFFCREVMRLTAQLRHFLLNEFRSFDRSHAEYKGLNDMVSYVDKECERRIVEYLSRLIPSAGFIAEESGEKHGEGYIWIVDPLDGTTNFIHGVPLFAISIALMKDDVLQIGVVHEVMQDECFYAVRGEGAFLNGKKIEVSPEKELAHALIATGFPYQDFERLEGYLSMFTDLIQKSHGIRRMGSAAVDLSFVACGRVEGFFEYGLRPWDVAAGTLIVEEAGGKVTDFSGGNNGIFGRELLAAGPLHAELLTLIQKNFKISP